MAASHCQDPQLIVIEQETFHGRYMMMFSERVVKAAALVATALLIVTPLSTAQGKKQTTVQTSKHPVADQKAHRVVLQVDTNDPAMMNLALNNATNVAQYYKDLGEKVSIEVVTFGPGLHMLRDDTSPVKARIEVIALSTPEISFKACGNTQENMHKVENKDIPLVPQAQVVKSGVVRILELQEQGWSYVKP
jgi:intracellular sulfur oxidation DsrE/DsrF family protein